MSFSVADRQNFYLQGQPTLWEVCGIPKGGNDFFIQITTDQVVWGGLSGATPAEAVSWGKVNPGVLPDTAVAVVDSTIGFRSSVSTRRWLAAQSAGSGKSSCTNVTSWLPPCASRQKKASKPKPSRERRSGMDEPGAEPKAKAESQEPEPSMGTLASELGGYAKRVSGQPRVYVDANVPAGLVSFMRQALHWDVLFVLRA